MVSATLFTLPSAHRRLAVAFPEQTIGNTIRRALHSLREDAIEEGIVAATAVQASSDVASSSTGTTPAPVPHAENGSRPRLSAFRPGSTFSISDLVAAGALSQDAEKGAKKAQALPSQADTLSENVRKVRLDDEDNQSQDSESSEKDSLENEAPEGSISQLSSVLLGVAEKLIEDIRGAPQEIGAKYALHHIHSGYVVAVGAMKYALTKFIERCFSPWATRARWKASFGMLLGSGASPSLWPNLLPTLAGIDLSRHCLPRTFAPSWYRTRQSMC